MERERNWNETYRLAETPFGPCSVECLLAWRQVEWFGRWALETLADYRSEWAAHRLNDLPMPPYSVWIAPLVHPPSPFASAAPLETFRCRHFAKFDHPKMIEAMLLKRFQIVWFQAEKLRFSLNIFHLKFHRSYQKMRQSKNEFVSLSPSILFTWMNCCGIPCKFCKLTTCGCICGVTNKRSDFMGVVGVAFCAAETWTWWPSADVIVWICCVGKKFCNCCNVITCGCCWPAVEFCDCKTWCVCWCCTCAACCWFCWACCAFCWAYWSQHGMRKQKENFFFLVNHIRLMDIVALQKFTHSVAWLRCSHNRSIQLIALEKENCKF